MMIKPPSAKKRAPAASKTTTSKTAAVVPRVTPTAALTEKSLSAPRSSAQRAVQHRTHQTARHFGDTLTFCSLGSGSEGNALLVAYQNTLIMVDCGFKISAIRDRLARHQLRPEDLSAIFVTHEHQDHLGGVASLARIGKVPIFGSRGTLKNVKSTQALRIHFCQDEQVKTIGALQLTPFSVPHDANEPLQVVISAGEGEAKRSLGVITDAGHVSPHMVKSLSSCHALYVEFNHDPLLLRHSSYPPRLRARIAGNYGHLSNQQAVKLLHALPVPKPLTLIAAHLSKKTNSPEKVHEALHEYLTQHPSTLVIANQETGFDWMTV